MREALPYIWIAAAAFVVTYLSVPLAKRLAHVLDAVDYPSSRRINKRPVPRMGGVAVFLGLVAALAVQSYGSLVLGWPPFLIPHPHMQVNYVWLACSVLIVFVTGFVDDVVSLSPRAKLFGQALGAAVAVAGGLVIDEVVNPLTHSGANISLGWVGYPLTVLYLVAFTNVINLIDGLDGLAGGITAIASLSMFSFAVLSHRVDAAALSIALAAACLAFLRFNFNPASIFLGDSGSLVLGFLLGVISLLNVSRTAALTSLLIPLIVAGVPIIDTFAAIVRRRRAHISVGSPDKGHMHHRLIQEGYNQRQAVLLIYGWSGLLALGAVVINQVGVELRVLIFCVLLLCSAAFAVHLHLFEPVLLHHYNPKTKRDEVLTPEDPAFADEFRREMHKDPDEEILSAARGARDEKGPAADGGRPSGGDQDDRTGR